MKHAKHGKSKLCVAGMLEKQQVIESMSGGCERKRPKYETIGGGNDQKKVTILCEVSWQE